MSCHLTGTRSCGAVGVNSVFDHSRASAGWSWAVKLRLVVVCSCGMLGHVSANDLVDII